MINRSEQQGQQYTVTQLVHRHHHILYRYVRLTHALANIFRSIEYNNGKVYCVGEKTRGDSVIAGKLRVISEIGAEFFNLPVRVEF